MGMLCATNSLATRKDKEAFYEVPDRKSAKKDIEKMFGVPQARWKIVKNLICQWDLDTFNNIMMACIIMNNIIIENK